MDGPVLKLEFSRISTTRQGALTLVLDYANGESCKVTFTSSIRKNLDDAIQDLLNREGGKKLSIIGFYSKTGESNSREKEALNEIKSWSSYHNFDAVIWTDLPPNFPEPFTPDSALYHILNLDAKTKSEAINYIIRTKDFIQTLFRRQIKTQTWFPHKCV